MIHREVHPFRAATAQIMDLATKGPGAQTRGRRQLKDRRAVFCHTLWFGIQAFPDIL